MSRKSIVLTVGILAVLLAGGVTILVVLLRHEPAFYRDAEQSPGAVRRRYAGEFATEVMSLRTAIREARVWSGQFTSEQINACFAEGFSSYESDEPEEKILPDDITDPRVCIDEDRLQLGFRYGRGLWSTLVSIELRIWVAAGEPNVIALELVSMHAGAVPITAQSLLEHVSEAARRKNVEVSWYRHRGNPVALLRFQGKRSRTTVQLEQVALESGHLLIQGRSVDPMPVRPAD